jgi:hypothetical protein
MFPQEIDRCGLPHEYNLLSHEYTFLPHEYTFLPHEYTFLPHEYTFCHMSTVHNVSIAKL